MNWAYDLLITNVLSTYFLMGLIWMVQIVHYPLFDNVGETHFVRYQQRHQNNITFIVGPVMLIELMSAIMMIWYPINEIEGWVVYVGLGLVLLIWFSTAFIQVPCHNKLSHGFDQQAYSRLVRSNWIRTVAWTGRGVLLTWLLLGLAPN